MDLTIVVVNYNSTGLLFNLVASIKKSLIESPIRYEIVVVDNASKNHDQYLLLKSKDFLTILNKENKGFGTACNQGISIAKGEHILLLNPDIQVLGKSIDRLTSFLERKSDIFVGGLLLNHDFSPQSSCGLFFSLPVVCCLLFLKGEKLGLTKFTPKKTQKVDWLSGACLAGRKTDFLKVGGFDENIFLYMEDVDLFYRAYKVGIECYFLKEAQFVHLGVATSPHKNSVLQMIKGLSYIYKKHNVSLLYVLQFLLLIKVLLGIIFSIVSLDKPLFQKYKEALTFLIYENRY